MDKHTLAHEFHMSSSVQAAFDQAATMRRSAVDAHYAGQITREHMEALSAAALNFRDAINACHPRRPSVLDNPPPAPVYGKPV